MKKYLKGIILVAILLIPIFIFLFLKFFGENRFDIPIYHTEGFTSPFAHCESYSGSYTVKGLSDSNLPGVYLFLKPNEDFDFRQVNNIKNRLTEALGDIGHTVFTTDSLQRQTNVLDAVTLRQKLNCDFISDTLNQYILVDSKSRIRGYYNTEREEIDRLIVEMKILLENERSGIER